MIEKSITTLSWLNETAEIFADNMLPTARLDAEIILAHTLSRPRTWLHAHSDEELDPRRRDIADARAQLRLERVPIAYIIGHKEFYGRRFRVSPDTLIPRPESESLIDLAKKYASTATHAVDIGTGSGCLGITLALEMPELSMTLADTSKRALVIAKQNAELHQANVRILESNLLDDYPLAPDLLVANLPYVDPSWTTNSPELIHEPADALYAGEHGLALIKRLLHQAATRMAVGAILLLEADERQHASIIADASKHHFTHLETNGLGLAFRCDK